MKTKLMTLLLMSTLAAFMILGCSDDDPTSDDNNDFPEGLAATWLQHSVTVNGDSVNLNLFFEWNQDAVKANVILNTNYTQRYEELDAQDSVLYYDEGTVSIYDQSCIVVVTSENGQAITPDTTFAGMWELDGNLLSLMAVIASDSVTSDTIVLVLTK